MFSLFLLPHLFAAYPPAGIKTYRLSLEPCSAEQYADRLCKQSSPLLAAAAPPSLLPFAGHGNSFLQGAFWGRFKQTQGWQAHYFSGSLISGDDATTNEMNFMLLVLSHSLLPKPLPAVLSLAYIPLGPVFQARRTSEARGQAIENAGESLAANPFPTRHDYFSACRTIVLGLQGYIPLSCFFVRLDSNFLSRWRPALEKEQDGFENTGQEGHHDGVYDPQAGFRAAAQRIQVPDTILLDLQCPEAEILAQMHKKHRYNIRLAEKKGVRVCEVPWREGLDFWYRIYQVTAQRDRIGIHSKAYYRDLFALAEEHSCEASLHLYLAYAPPDSGPLAEEPQPEAKGQLGYCSQTPQPPPQSLGGIIVLHYLPSSCATYLYGASANELRELMPNYLLQWHAITQAKRAGMLSYDFFGIPPHGDPTHPLYGLYRFKIGFGGYAIRRPGAWDLPYSWLFYALYRILERGRAFCYQLRHR